MNMANNALFATVAALSGDPARAAMLQALMDGRALTASELARVAGITPQTASGHLMGMARDKQPVRLTNNFVAKLSGEAMWWDDDPKATGFGIRSYPGGGKSFFVDYRLNGRQRRYTIGPFPRWSAEAAREEAKKLRRRIDRGEDPAGDKRARRTAPTIQDLIDRYVEDHLPTKTLVGLRVNDEKKMLAEVGAKLGPHT